MESPLPLQICTFWIGYALARMHRNNVFNQRQACFSVPGMCAHSSCAAYREEEVHAVIFMFNYNTPAAVLVPISKLVWNIKANDIDPQQVTIYIIKRKYLDKCIKAHLLSSTLEGNKMNKAIWPATLTVLPNRLKPIDITIETSGCGRAWKNLWAGINSSKHFPRPY